MNVTTPNSKSRAFTIGRRLALMIACGIAPLTASAQQPGAASIQYNRDIRPILAENCFACHGPDSAARKGDLRLDREADAMAMRDGLAPIAKGDPAKSGVMERVLSNDPDLVMPPPSSHKKLKPAQIELLRRWIAAGAEYEAHWSLIAPARPMPPTVAPSQGVVRNPIDQFILAKVRELGLTQAPEADRRTLARRAALDATGLPPNPEDVEAFVHDASPGAYEAYLDKLFDSPHYGEHRARYWLDAARYADTHGIHFDNYREMWSYRDWVIQAFNRDLPFDQFTVEQLAGDLLPNRSLDQQVASGFNRCNITTNEGGIIDEEYVVLYARDRTETTSQVWMGLTMGCAVCHDHKFDPVSQRDFYQMAAFFNNTTQGARDGNVKDSPPIIVVPLENDLGRWNELAKDLPAARGRLEERRAAARPEFNAWSTTATAELLRDGMPKEPLAFHAKLQEGSGTTTSVQIGDVARDVQLSEKAAWRKGPAGGSSLKLDGGAFETGEAGDFDWNEPFSAAAWVKLPANDGSFALCARMDDAKNYRGWDFWVQGRRVGSHIINNWSEDAIKVVAASQVKANEWTHVAVTYDGTGKASGVKVYYNGAVQKTNTEADTLKSTTRASVPFKVGQRHNSSPAAAVEMHDLRIYKAALAAGSIGSLAKLSRFEAVLAKPADQRSKEELDGLFVYWLEAFDAEFQARGHAVAALEREEAAIKSRGTIAHVMNEKMDAQPMAHILFRGEYDKRRDEVSAQTPASLPPFPDDLPKNRLGLARWLLRPEHPLTARVTVNRFWQELFGTGLVRTAGDFGISGELPSHPELLDWLAVDFRESGWNVRRFFKQVMLSAAYRQSAQTTEQKLQIDPQNRWLSRGPRFRMDAEVVRDTALAASGLLVRKIGGPSVRPYQPEGVWEAVAMIGSNTRDYRADTGENLYRRSLYTFWKRSAPPASLEIFNAPSREVCTVRRERTNTPLQALVTLNDPQFMESARALAERVIRAEPSAEPRIQKLAAIVLSRPLRPAEVDVVQKSLNRLTSHYAEARSDAVALSKVGERQPPGDVPPVELAAWTMVASALLNLDEALCK